jgi:heme/copper-type cytochrome/quinol oxidase subunit 2
VTAVFLMVGTLGVLVLVVSLGFHLQASLERGTQEENAQERRNWLLVSGLTILVLAVSAWLVFG